MASSSSMSSRASRSAAVSRSNRPKQSKAKQPSQPRSQARAAPVARSKVIFKEKPSIVTFPDGRCRIRNREYLQDILAATGTPSSFSVVSVPINPGQPTFAPWLSSIAQRFESYKFNSLKFEYETEAPSSLGGTLMMSVDYDASDPSPLSKQQMMAYEGAVRSAPWTDCEHTSTSSNLHKLTSHYVRPAAQPANTDIKTYDIGNLFIGTQNVTTASAVCGELYVTYDVELLTPVFEPNEVVVGGSFNGAVSMTAANPLGTTPTSDAGNFGISVGATSVVTFAQPGNYLIGVVLVGTVISAVSLVGAGGTVGTVSSAIPAAATTLVAVTSFVTTQANATLTFTATATTITASIFRVGSAPSGSLVP